MQQGRDIARGLLSCRQRIQRHYFEKPDRWYLVRYEDLDSDPRPTVKGILDYLGLSYEAPTRFPRFKRCRDGDDKPTEHRNLMARSKARY